VNKETGEISDAPKINAGVDSSKLKSMLAGLKSASE
jgi:hypothetical protein